MTHEFDGKKYEKASTHQREWGTKLIAEMDLLGTESVLDLGCGDGRIVIAAAKLGATATGVGAGLATFLGQALPGRVIPFVFSAENDLPVIRGNNGGVSIPVNGGVEDGTAEEFGIGRHISSSSRQSQPQRRFAYVIKTFEVITTGGLFAIAIGIFGMITFGLFQALGIELDTVVARLIFAGGGGTAGSKGRSAPAFASTTSGSAKPVRARNLATRRPRCMEGR